MLTITFRTPAQLQEVSCDTSRLVISPTALYCDGEDKPFAEFCFSLWRVGGNYFTSADIDGGVEVQIGPRQTGPFPRMKLISGCLFVGDEMVARVEGGKWYSYGDDSFHDAILIEHFPANVTPIGTPVA